MSAFLVSDAHISFIVNCANVMFRAYNSMPGGATLSDPQGLGAILHKANVDSVNHRYPQSADEPVTPWVWKPGKLSDNSASLETLVKFLKALDCLEYQSCEPDNWQESQAYLIIDRLRGMAIAKLPGYDSAPWGIAD